MQSIQSYAHFEETLLRKSLSLLMIMHLLSLPKFIKTYNKYESITKGISINITSKLPCSKRHVLAKC